MEPEEPPPSPPIEGPEYAPALDPVPPNICAICDNALLLRGLRGILPPCGHKFHKSCIVRWTNEHEGDRCPLCNEIYTEIRIRYPEGMRLNGAQRSREQDIPMPERIVTCGICHRNLYAVLNARLHCTHQFCLECLREWATQRREGDPATCPNCRHPFVEYYMRYPEVTRRTRAMARRELVPFPLPPPAPPAPPPPFVMPPPFVEDGSDSDDDVDVGPPPGEMLQDWMDEIGDEPVVVVVPGGVVLEINRFSVWTLMNEEAADDDDDYYLWFAVHCRVCEQPPGLENPIIRCTPCWRGWHLGCNDGVGPPRPGITGEWRCRNCEP